MAKRFVKFAGDKYEVVEVPGAVVIVSPEGDVAAHLPKGEHTDEMVICVLNVKRESYRQGFDSGMSTKARQLRELLGIGVEA